MADLEKNKILKKKKKSRNCRPIPPSRVLNTICFIRCAGRSNQCGRCSESRFRQTGSDFIQGLFCGGKVFDSNMDKTSPNNQPLSVIMGTNGVIKGMDDGYVYSVKAVGKIFIPAMLGYGQNGYPPTIGLLKSYF